MRCTLAASKLEEPGAANALKKKRLLSPSQWYLGQSNQILHCQRMHENHRKLRPLNDQDVLAPYCMYSREIDAFLAQFNSRNYEVTKIRD